MILQLDPPIPLETPKGQGYAHLVVDYGMDFDLCWTVFITKSRECWTFQNKEVRAVSNVTFKRSE